MSAPPIVTATDLHRRYGQGDAAVDALDGVSVVFERGVFAAIMGASGSGKSTLMHTLAGLDRPIIVSLIGIVVTLFLSIQERTRELGMLRVVGMSRRQVRRVIRYEAVITAEIGAILGLTLGVVFAVLVSRPLADEGFKLAIPVGTLVVLLLLAALAGVLAAVLPARRAAGLEVLEAISYE